MGKKMGKNGAKHAKHFFPSRMFTLSKLAFLVGSIVFINRCLHLQMLFLLKYNDCCFLFVWLLFFFNCRYEKVPVILVGNKVDLESEREVSSNEGRALAEEWGCPFMETSAKSKTMVDELFAEIVRQMNYAAQPDKDDPCCSACNIQ